MARDPPNESRTGSGRERHYARPGSSASPLFPLTSRLVVATSNLHKASEIEALIREHAGDRADGIEIVPAPSNLLYPPEGSEYKENALAKARAACAATNLPAVADDSGIEVRALGDAPGPQSARYGPTDAARIARILRELSALGAASPAARRASFRCIAALAFPDGTSAWAEGVWSGEILPAPRGRGGFGYDPIFLDPRAACSAAEMTSEEKRSRSHRGRAFRALLTPDRIERIRG